MLNFQKLISQRQSSRDRAAFTLLEMMVSLAIITLITSMFIANYRTGNKRTDLTMTAQSLVADLHQAQNKTLGLVQYNGTVPSGGWGVSFDVAKSNYTIFADLDQPGASGYMQFSSSTEGNVAYGARVTSFPANIQILSLKVGNSTSSLVSVNQVNVTFLPPDPQTNIYSVSNGATSSLLQITIKETFNNSIKTIMVNFLGLAEVVD
jgi:prepilin-type N-terminal cleavage/methylation domain-containing protein